MKNWSEYNIAIISSLGCGYSFHEFSSSLLYAPSENSGELFFGSVTAVLLFPFYLGFSFHSGGKRRQTKKKYIIRIRNKNSIDEWNEAAIEVKYGFSYYWTLLHTVIVITFVPVFRSHCWWRFEIYTSKYIFHRYY